MQLMGQDGDWLDASEQIATSLAVNVGLNNVSYTIPAGTPAGYYFLRFRLSRVGGLSPGGSAANGEVEDYAY